MLRFILGTVVISAPRGNVAIFGTIVAVRVVRGLVKKIKKKKELQKDVEETISDKVEPVTLEWEDLACELVDKKGNRRILLHKVSGKAVPGRLLAIMGPSGSGKTTLLNALSNHVPCRSRLQLRGLINANGRPVSEGQHRQAYVQQEDLFYSQLTVQETLDMEAKLHLPEELAADAQAAHVSHLLQTLGLARVVDTRVGDVKTRGLSGGEKKRLSIGCELIRSPSLIFLDEPTTGLDSFQADKVVAALKLLTSAGHTILCSIHQPRSSIFSNFDDLLVLAEGQVVYFGPAEGALEYFGSQGHTCPQHFNPADFIADLVSIDHSSSEAEELSYARVQALAQAWAGRGAGEHLVAGENGTGSSSNGGHKKVRLGRQLALLFQRSWRQVTRDRGTMVARLMSNVSSAVVFGCIFFRMKLKQSTIQDRLGLLQVCAINAAMSSLVKTLQVFPTERTIVSRERAKGAYEVLPYLTSKLLAELPIGALFPALFGALVYPTTGLNPNPIRFLRFLGLLTLESFSSSALGLAVGAFAPSPEAAVAIGPAVMLVWIVFGGYYVNSENVPWAFKWLPKASLIRQGFEGLCINEFEGMEFELDEKNAGMKDGTEVLQWLSFAKSSVREVTLRQARILLFYYWATYNILRANKPKFQTLKPPASRPAPPALATTPPPRPASGVEMSALPSAASAASQWSGVDGGAGALVNGVAGGSVNGFAEATA